ncbi:unnamed protein product [Candidula unifasciata]|uniref:Uncharacterized protein n=1 Tax=Candidula unifasciata TaxID=100452 RepID=A0A8S3YWL9_9EUPU|nr:unnamed protein product [Candidula unifasciata]
MTGQLEAERSNELQSEDPWKIMTPRLNPQLIKQNDQEKPIYDKENNFHCELVHNNQQSALKILNPNDLESFKHQDNVATCHHTVSDSRYNATYSHSRKINLAQAMPESEQPTFPKHGVQDILNVRDNITSTQWLKLNHSYAEQIRQMNAHVCSNADNNKLASATSECYKDKEKTKCGSSNFSNEGNDAQTVVSSGKHLTVLTYILSAAVLVLTIAVMRLHVKIKSLEASRDVFNSNYQSGEKQAKFVDKQLLGTTNTRETNEKLAALFLTPRLGMTNTEQGTYQNNDDNTDRSDADVQHTKFTKQYNNPHAFRRIITYMPTSTKEAKTEVGLHYYFRKLLQAGSEASLRLFHVY